MKHKKNGLIVRPQLKGSLISLITGVLCVAGGVYLGTSSEESSFAAPPAAPAKKVWQMSFNDEFNGSTLDTSKWVTCYDWYKAEYQGCTNGGNQEMEWYKASQVTLANGLLKLTAEKKDTPGTDYNGTGTRTYPYVSGMITTGRPQYNGQNKFTTKYGYYEARINVPSGRGIWPAFWLHPADKTWPPEIDIMEILGHEPTKTHMTYHWPGPQGERQSTTSSFVGPNYTNSWHTYAVQWQPGQLIWYVDGVVRKTYSNANVASKDMQILLNLAVGGNWPGAPDAQTVFPAHMYVDYVRVYQLADAPVEKQPDKPADTTGSSKTGSGSGNSGAGTGSGTGSGQSSGNSVANGTNKPVPNGNEDNPNLTAEALSAAVPIPTSAPEVSLATSQQEIPRSVSPKHSPAKTIALVSVGALLLGISVLFALRHRLYQVFKRLTVVGADATPDLIVPSIDVVPPPKQ